MQEQESNLPAHWSLNTEQQAAVLHGDEPLLLIAGAGTGKTTTLVHRVAYHLLSGVHPARVLLLTFTRKAAQQMLQRLLKLCHEMEANELDSFDINGLWAGTFHAIGTRLLKLYGGAIGLSPRFTIHDRSDAEDLMDALLQKLKKEQQSKLAGFPKKGTLLRIFGFQVNSQLTLERVLDDHFPDYLQWLPTLKRLFSQYRQHQHEFSIADYDTLLLMLRDLVRLPDVSRQLQERFQYVLVDEYQDTNPVQAQILQGICPDGRGLTVVGDDAQSIYSFRAATIRNILDFPEQFRDTKLLKLTQNYRSTQPLLAASNAVISAAKERFDKQLWSQRQSDELPVLASLDDESEQASWVVDQIEEQRQAGISLSQQAVLFRAAFHSLALETELARRKIPFVKWGGLKFAESAHVKDLLAYLRLAENRRDTIAALRILLLLPGIGPKKAGNLVEVLDSSTTAFEVWKDMPPSAANKGIWSQFVKLMIKLSTDEMKLVDQLKQVLHFYSPLMEDRYD
ncbi:MAG: ATP-dependent helicase, partial [Planctomycetales bacterium]|nr:ATP-dependent helicase [Planctomycetales bacterium]